MANHPVEAYENFLSEVRKYYAFRLVKVPASVGLLLADIAAFLSKATHTKPLVPKDFILGLVSDAYNSSIEKAISEGYEEKYSITQGIKETIGHLESQNIDRSNGN